MKWLPVFVLLLLLPTSCSTPSEQRPLEEYLKAPRPENEHTYHLRLNNNSQAERYLKILYVHRQRHLKLSNLDNGSKHNKKCANLFANQIRNFNWSDSDNFHRNQIKKIQKKIMDSGCNRNRAR